LDVPDAVLTFDSCTVVQIRSSIRNFAVGESFNINVYWANVWLLECSGKAGVPLKLILLVDDSRFIRMANERSLTRAGYSVVTAINGEEALQTARARIPDLILLDMLLPKVGGPEVLRALKQDPLTTSIPVVVLSSLPQRNGATLIREGATAYFEKSKLESDDKGELLAYIVKKALDGAAVD
jgi:twitching motility two-component system response regulator PilH